MLILQEPPAPFKLPDGRLVSVSSEEAAELAAGMLSPSLAGVDCLSVAETAAAAIFTHLDPAVRKVGSPLLQALVRLQPKQLCISLIPIPSRACPAGPAPGNSLRWAKLTIQICLQAAVDAVVVCGGGSAVPGIGHRLCRELRQLLPPSMTPCTVSLPEYMPGTTLQYAAWFGGAVLSKVCALSAPGFALVHRTSLH